MVGIFSKFSVGRTGHRRAQSAIDGRQSLQPNDEVSSVASVGGEVSSVASVGGAVSTHGIEIAVEFKPVEHPVEPLDNDSPIQCPLPEPSVLNDGRIWKERVSRGFARGEDLAIMPEGSQAEVESPKTKPRPRPRTILPSISAPEHNVLQMLEETGL